MDPAGPGGGIRRHRRPVDPRRRPVRRQPRGGGGTVPRRVQRGHAARSGRLLAAGSADAPARRRHRRARVAGSIHGGGSLGGRRLFLGDGGQPGAGPRCHDGPAEAREAARGSSAIGTTGRGIGPAYEDKVARRGLRLGDLYRRETLAGKLGEIIDYHNFQLTNYYKVPPVDFQKTLDMALEWGEQLRELIADVPGILHDLRREGAQIMFEGAQGSLLDIDHGTYPFVTSSNTTAGGVSTGSGFGPLYLDYVLGITKAYTTRVGGGPFPTELFDETGARLAQVGHEFGSTTGRARRCGWFDAVVLRRAVELNSISGLCLTKLDVLDGLPVVKVCTGYETRESGSMESLMTDAVALSDVVPIDEELPGWAESTVGVQKLEDLPENALAYIRRIEELVGCPIDIISTGPDREETIVLRHPFQ